MSKSFKRNYVDVYQIITPSYYKGLDISLSSDTVDIVDRILESDFKLIEENLRVIPLSAEPLATILGYDGSYCSALPQYFVKQNKLTNVTPEEFELVVLNPMGYSMKDYNTSGDFSAFVVNTLLPNIGIGFDSTVNNVFARSQGKYAATEEATHRYLLESLGLFHILSYQRGASTGVTLNYRTELAELYSRKLFAGETLELADAIKVMKTAIWKCTNSSVKDPVFFDLFALGEGVYTSGDQQLDKMNTWTDVIYNENYSEETDEYVRDAVEEFMDNGTYPDNEIPNGPFYRFQRAVGFLTADINDQIVSLETLHSIENCPTNLLPYLADIIGWEFYTSNTDAWRRQLRSAVSLYKKKGTSGGLESLLKVILPSFDLDFDEMYSEFYESYVPNLIYYMLKTESFLTSGTGAWTPALANDFAGGEFDPINIDASVRFVVDHILL
jgi:phage tail-like protein